MPPQTCDLCDDPALISETTVRCGVIKVRRLCRAHGLKIWRDAVIPATEHLARNSRKRTIKSAITVPPAAYRHERKGR